MARVGVAAGTATAVSNRVSRRQANRWAGQEQEQYAQQQQQYAPPPAAAAAPDDKLDKLKELGQLHESGVLTDEEFTQQKTLILNS
jgi:hypothetical protein